MQKADRVKILCVNYDSNPYSGVVVFLMNVFRYINHEEFMLDFLTPNETSYKAYEQEINKANGMIYALHVDANSPIGKLRYGNKLYAFLKNHTYDIIHINSGSISFDCVSAIVAKFSGAKVIIHSHSTGGRSWWKDCLVYFSKLLMQREADVLCACSQAAAECTFTSRKVKKGDVTIIKNGIDLQKFRYNEVTRRKIREELNLEGHLVIGHVGRFVEQKNHKFIIDIFEEILRKEPSAVLLLIGQGELEPEIREKVYKLNLDQNVIFCGGRSDVENYYQAMDIFLFPSFYEGLPISLIEVQASGLVCMVSDTITREVDITPLVYRMSLHESAQKWAEKVLSVAANINKRSCYEQEIKKAGYEIENTAIEISNIYERLMQ